MKSALKILRKLSIILATSYSMKNSIRPKLKTLNENTKIGTSYMLYNWTWKKFSQPQYKNNKSSLKCNQWKTKNFTLAKGLHEIEYEQWNTLAKHSEI